MMDAWSCVPAHSYGVAVAIDVLEHVHPNEIRDVLAQIDRALVRGGRLVMHVTWNQVNQPQHYDHSAIVEPWLAEGYDQQSESVWIKRRA